MFKYLLPQQKISTNSFIRIAAAIDSFGSGLVMMLGVLFFVITTDIPLATIGFAVAAGGVLSLPIGITGGWVIDAQGSKFGMVLNNILAALGFILFLFAKEPYLIFLASLLIAVGDRIYWAAWTTYIHDLSENQPYEHLFSRLEATKMAAMSIGATLGAVSLAYDSTKGAYFSVILNILVTIVAAIIYGVSPMPQNSKKETLKSAEEDLNTRRAVKTIFSQPGFFLIMLGQFLLAPIMVLPNVALSVFFVNNWGMTAAVAPVIFGINAATVAIFQTKTTHLVRNYNRSHIVFFSTVLVATTLIFLSLTPPNGINRTFSWFIIVLVGIVLAIVDMLYMPATNALMAEIPTDSVRGKSVGLFQTSMAVGMAVYPSTVGLLDSHPSYLWALTALSTLGGGICYIFAVRKAPEQIKYSAIR